MLTASDTSAGRRLKKAMIEDVLWRYHDPLTCLEVASTVCDAGFGESSKLLTDAYIELGSEALTSQVMELLEREV